MQGKNAVNPNGFTSILTKHRHKLRPLKSGSDLCAMLKEEKKQLSSPLLNYEQNVKGQGKSKNFSKKY